MVAMVAMVIIVVDPSVPMCRCLTLCESAATKTHLATLPSCCCPACLPIADSLTLLLILPSCPSPRIGMSEKHKQTPVRRHLMPIPANLRKRIVLYCPYLKRKNKVTVGTCTSSPSQINVFVALVHKIVIRGELAMQSIL